MIGKKIGNRYEILALIGGGGMSLVYQAKDIYLNRIVAVKVLREQFTSDNEFVRRFRREAQAVASLSHPNIVSIYDVGQEQDIHYLVMEYIKGKTLKELIQEKAPLPLPEVIDIVKQICDALEHAHENAIVHRDIKPHNIIITRGGRVKVTDFGIARAVSTATVTHTRGIIGSVHYFSPEQAKGEITGEKSDIYSLGIVLYEMVTGKLPFEGESPISVALMHIQNEPIPPSHYNPNLPENIEKIILKAINKNPNERYENAAKLRLDLRVALLDKMTMGIGENLDQEPPKEKTNSPAVSDDTLVFTDLPLVENQGQAEKPSEKKIRKIKPMGYVLISFLAIIILGGLIWGFSQFWVKEIILVPDIIEHSAPEAQRILAEKDLKMAVEKEIFHAEIPKDHIISQDPLPNTETKAGRTISVVVSSGPRLVPVPMVIGSSQIIADVDITNSNLILGEVEPQYSSRYPNGVVIDQQPKAGELVPEKSQVNLVVSKGPEPFNISMPPLVGLDLSKVEAELQKAGLELGEIKREKSEVYSRNFVIEQNPAAGNEVLQGSKVNLIVSEGPGPSTQSYRVVVRLNEPGQVKIQVRDVQGTRIAYDHYHERGDVFVVNVNFFGQGVITVYLNDKQIKEEVVPLEQ
ncbi:MAG: Stk1 family PASTA domain-containing Ser/Thr kinase [Peptococcales bacterium]|jgi:serine/threonine protein kinase